MERLMFELSYCYQNNLSADAHFLKQVFRISNENKCKNALRLNM